MKINVEKLMNEYFNKAYDQTKELIKIPSYRTDAIPKAPFGKGTKDVLDYAINLSKELGFETYQDPENRYGFLDYGNGDELFVILCHLDVVPPGNMEKWITNPFEPIEEDGKLIGRGSIDDKGPTMMNLYALKYLKDHGYESKKYKIRIIFGLDEETTWDSIRAYVDDHGIAKAGYVPDGEFPVIYAEKWIVYLDMLSNYEVDFEINGGVACNVVCDVVTYKGPKINEIKNWLDDNKIECKIEKELLTVQGAAAHGSLPWLGVNAITWLAKSMKENGFDHPLINFLANDVHLNFNATTIFKNKLEDETGVLTQNLGLISIKNKEQKISFNYRVPVFTEPKEKFIPAVEEYIKKYGLKAEIDYIEDSVYVPKNSDLIKKIMNVYQETTGDLKAVPLAIGGGTYAKAMPNIVAFGAIFDVASSTMHAYNEFVYVDELKKMLEIYTKAIVLLTQ